MIAVLVTFVLSAFLCGVYRAVALRKQFVDRPNARSSHQQPTPLGGGLPLFAAFFIGLGVAALVGARWQLPLLLLAGATLPLALMGWYDDLRSLSIRVRLALYVPLVVLFVWLSLVQQPDLAGALLVVLLVVLSVALLWLLNLYNFMDGIDGIAAVQAILACTAAAWLCEGRGSPYALYCMLFAAAMTGFLLWNWPPARLFMGDAGSVPTGFILGGLCLLGWVQGVLNPAVWLILLALFIVDATWTLLWRMASGAAFTQPHREHAYQRLSRRWGSHLRVDVCLIAIVVCWLFPLAWMAQQWPAKSLILVILAYLPWVITMAKIRLLK